jgi:hypothetical protein
VDLSEESCSAVRQTGDRSHRRRGATGHIERGAGGELLRRPAAQWVETLTSLVLELGFNAFVFWPAGDQPRQVAAFAANVVPAVRSEVASARASL